MTGNIPPAQRNLTAKSMEDAGSKCSLLNSYAQAPPCGSKRQTIDSPPQNSCQLDAVDSNDEPEVSPGFTHTPARKRLRKADILSSSIVESSDEEDAPNSGSYVVDSDATEIIGEQIEEAQAENLSGVSLIKHCIRTYYIYINQ